MTMKPKLIPLAATAHAIDLDSGKWVDAPLSSITSIPIVGFANSPQAEEKWLRAEIAECFEAVQGLLERYRPTFEQRIEVYNRIPLGKTAEVISESDLINLIEEVCHD